MQCSDQKLHGVSQNAHSEMTQKVCFFVQKVAVLTAGTMLKISVFFCNTIEQTTPENDKKCAFFGKNENDH